MSKKLQRPQLDINLSEWLTQWGTINSPSISNSDSLEEGINKIVTILDKLVPPTPPRLEDATLIPLNALYSSQAYIADGNAPTIFDNIVQFQNLLQLITKTVGGTYDGYFYDADSGILTANINTYNNAQATLSASDDTGIYSASDNSLDMNILDDADIFANTTSENFWKALLVRLDIRNDILSIIPSQSMQTATMNHSLTGTLAYNFYLEKSDAPSLFLATSTAIMTGIVSGVATLQTADNINMHTEIDNIVKFFYPSLTELFKLYGNDTNTLQYYWPLPLSPIANSRLITDNALNCNDNHFSNTSLSISIDAYDSIGQMATFFHSNPNLRIDTNSLAVKAMDATKRTLGFDVEDKSAATVYDHSISLKSGVYANQLQLLNGFYQYPTSFNYTNYLFNGATASPNYSTGISETYRWASFRFNLTTSSNYTTSVNLAFDSNTGISYDSQLSNDVKIYYKVVSSIGETVWVDAQYYVNNNTFDNGNYIMVGYNGNTANDLYVNSVNGVNIGTQTLANRKFTIGNPIPNSGIAVTVYVRIAIKQNTAHKFRTINVTIA